MSIKTKPAETKQLTKREWDCVKLAMSGKTAKEVARALQISYRTVELHLQQARLKFKSKNRMELFYKIIVTDEI